MSRFASTIILAILLVCAALLAAAGAAPDPVLASPVYAPEIQIAGGPSAQNAPRCASGIQAWQDDAGDWNVWVGWKPAWAVVAAGTSAQRHPDVSAHVVAFEDDRAGDWDIYAWDATTPADPVSETAVATGPGDQLDPAVGGTFVVYEDHARGNADIGLYDLVSEKKWLLTTNASPQVDPATDGRWVVWADRRHGNWDIYAYDLQRGVTKRLTRSKADQKAPQVGQNKVVYQDRRNGNWDIYLYSLTAGKERRLTRHKADQTLPQIDPSPVESRTGNIVYVDDRRDKGDLWVRDGRTGISRPVCTEPGTQTAPGIAAEQVVWADARDGQPDVYTAGLLFPTLSVPGKLTCAYGGTLKLTGRLYGDRVAGQKVRVAGYGATRTARVKSAGSGVGTFTLYLKRVRKKLKLRVWYPGNGSHLPAWGGTVSVTPRAALSRPRLARTPPKPPSPGLITGHEDRCTISGTLKPRHANGSRAVTLYVYRTHKYWSSWKLYKTLRPKVRNGGNASTYRVRLDLSSWYSWSVQAVHQDSGHARTESAFSATIRQKR